MSEPTLKERLTMTAEERELIPAIVHKVMQLAKLRNRELDYIKLYADILFCHKLHCPMKLREWHDADAFAFLADAMTLYHQFQGTPIYALRDGARLMFAVSNESRIWVPPNISHERKFDA